MQRHQADARQSQMQSEIEVRATGLATRFLDQLATLPYDENLSLGDVSLLTPQQTVGAALSLDKAVYLPDVDGLRFVSTMISEQGALDFDVAVNVRYVQSLNGRFVPSFSPSYFREATVEITSALNTTLTVTRIYAPI